MSSEIVIRRFVPADMQKVMDLEKASFVADAFSEATFTAYYQECPDLFLVAELPDQVVGYMITQEVSAKGSLIVSIAVDPSHRLKGVARTLADFTMRHLAKAGTQAVALRVRTTNIDGRCFWERLGFTVVSAIPNFYCDGGEALQMSKSLGDPLMD